MVTIFQERTWYQLRAASQALRLPFDTHWSRRQAQDRLRGRALDGGELKRRLARLTPREHRALQTLQASGPMIRSRFSRHFGGIRICRQRHPVKRAAVWRTPYSPPSGSGCSASSRSCRADRNTSPSPTKRRSSCRRCRSRSAANH
ncbi:MAG: hypothetical protein IPK19_25130 [Chloroflexi bacterium]|nr:hypothetical protein [Chloroflexota bacterium]